MISGHWLVYDILDDLKQLFILKRELNIDDLVYQIRYKYKEKNKLIENAKLEAEKRVQEYLNKLEQWTNDWRLTLAPHKCGQITFTKAKNQETDDLLNVRLYNVNIPIEKFPKFLKILTLL